MKNRKYQAKKPDNNGFIHYTEQENETWNTLITRQQEIILPLACDEYLHGLELLNMPNNHIPQCSEISAVLQQHTGWAVQEVAEIIPLSEFFQLLANRRFPAATFIRSHEDLDYLQEPDIFHEFFGHCPLLTHQAYADFLQWYGKQAVQAERRIQNLMGRLFWFTIEFGLIKKNNGFSIYGGGILSSKEESIYAVESDIPQRNALDIKTVLRTPYRYDIIQPLYYYLSDLKDLYTLMDIDLIDIIKSTHELGDLQPNFITC
jgi:phenylalanine-4-hydroxylase